jgi:asparagine N-glycosylation enzyme membrane subunit Stt3
MKKIVIITAIFASPILLTAQSVNSDVYDRDTFNACASIFVVGLFMLFILTVAKRIMDYRLKNKIIEKGIPETIISSILQTNPKEDRNLNIKWFAILSGLGIGLIIVNYTQPLGIHSLAIMAISISISFLGYFFYLKHSEK